MGYFLFPHKITCWTSADAIYSAFDPLILSLFTTLFVNLTYKQGREQEQRNDPE